MIPSGGLLSPSPFANVYTMPRHANFAHSFSPSPILCRWPCPTSLFFARPHLSPSSPEANLSSKESLQSMESSHHRSWKSGGEMPTKGISSAGRSLVLPASLLPWRCLLFPPHHERCTSLAFPIYSPSSEIPLTAKSQPLIPNSRTSGGKPFQFSFSFLL